MSEKYSTISEADLDGVLTYSSQLLNFAEKVLGSSILENFSDNFRSGMLLIYKIYTHAWSCETLRNVPTHYGDLRVIDTGAINALQRICFETYCVYFEVFVEGMDKGIDAFETRFLIWKLKGLHAAMEFRKKFPDEMNPEVISVSQFNRMVEELNKRPYFFNNWPPLDPSKSNQIKNLRYSPKRDIPLTKAAKIDDFTYRFLRSQDSSSIHADHQAAQLSAPNNSSSQWAKHGAKVALMNILCILSRCLLHLEKLSPEKFRIFSNPDPSLYALIKRLSDALDLNQKVDRNSDAIAALDGS